MPCRDSWDDGATARQENQQKLDRLTQFLCYMCGEAELSKGTTLPKPIADWWRKHQKADYERVKKEMQAVVERHWDGAPEGMANDFIRKAEAVHPVSTYHKQWFLSIAREVCEELYQKQQAQAHQNDVRAKALAKLTPEERRALRL